jgi:hypothetical protein
VSFNGEWLQVFKGRSAMSSRDERNEVLNRGWNYPTTLHEEPLGQLTLYVKTTKMPKPFIRRILWKR